MAIIALTNPALQFFDDAGDPVASGFLYTYLAGTSTPEPTYADSDATPNENPVELDSAGRCVVYVPDDVSLKLILKDADLVTLWTQDNVSPAELAV